MAIDRGRLVMLAALLILLGGLVYRGLVPGLGTSAALAPASNPPGARGAGATSTPARNRGAGDVLAPAVHLDVLNGERPKPSEGERNLFRFKPKAAPAPPQAREPPPV